MTTDTTPTPCHLIQAWTADPARQPFAERPICGAADHRRTSLDEYRRTGGVDTAGELLPICPRCVEAVDTLQGLAIDLETFNTSDGLRQVLGDFLDGDLSYRNLHAFATREGYTTARLYPEPPPVDAPPRVADLGEFAALPHADRLRTAGVVLHAQAAKPRTCTAHPIPRSGCAACAYDHRDAGIRSDLLAILELLADHREAFADRPVSWPMAGDLAHVGTTLGELRRFLQDLDEDDDDTDDSFGAYAASFVDPNDDLTRPCAHCQAPAFTYCDCDQVAAASPRSSDA